MLYRFHAERPATPVIVLISGYARAGKGKLSNEIWDAIFGGTFDPAPADYYIREFNFADQLKHAANRFLEHLDLFKFGDHENPDRVSFFHDKFKNQHRDALVSMGKLARGVDKDIFASMFLKSVANNTQLITNGQNYKNDVVIYICSDWRYLNEYEFIRHRLGQMSEIYGKHMANDGFIVPIYVETENVLPANDEELQSIAEIHRELNIPVFKFANAQHRRFDRAGRDLANYIIERVNARAGTNRIPSDYKFRNGAPCNLLPFELAFDVADKYQTPADDAK